MKIFLNILFSLSIIVILMRVFRVKIRRWLYKMQVRIKFSTVRTAIKEADADKAATDRKNIVVFNPVSQQYEPMQKRLMKFLSRHGINGKGGRKTNNAAKTKYRLRNQQGGRRKMKPGSVHVIEKESLYVTN